MPRTATSGSAARQRSVRLLRQSAPIRSIRWTRSIRRLPVATREPTPALRERAQTRSLLSGTAVLWVRSEEHTSELQSLMHISYAVFCLKEKNQRIESEKFLHRYSEDSVRS